MIVKAWIQMGVERRETAIEIPDDEFKAGMGWVQEDAERCLEGWLEQYVLDWQTSQYGWGWAGAGFENDFSFMEGNDSGGFGALCTTSRSSIPNTKRLRRDHGQRCPECGQSSWTEYGEEAGSAE